MQLFFKGKSQLTLNRGQIVHQNIGSHFQGIVVLPDLFNVKRGQLSEVVGYVTSCGGKCILILILDHLVNSRHHYILFPKNIMITLLLVNCTRDKILVQEERFHVAHKSIAELNYIYNQGIFVVVNNFTNLLYGRCSLTLELHLLIRILEQQQ